jgi:hypothetical protein
VVGSRLKFGPGMSSDDDFLMKIWLAGCRVFRVIGASRVYHFGCATTRRVRRNKGGRTFILKWGISQHEFMRSYVRRTASADPASLPNIPRPGFAGRMKRAVYALGRYPTSDLQAWEPDLPRQIVMDMSLGQRADVE